MGSGAQSKPVASGATPAHGDPQAELERRPSKDQVYLDAVASGRSFDCFLSHTHRDAHDIALRVFDNLKYQGVRPFIDRECLDRLPELEAHVRESRTLVFFMSTNIFQSAWCMLEVTIAVESGIEIIPILVEGSVWGKKRERRFPEVDKDVPESIDVQGVSCLVITNSRHAVSRCWPTGTI